ncbi:hypothetical protein AGMMS49928_05020 [Spirochaetia bacterium]|nr:hypothetical protein AGMMS49928_05020 [Spirochaetia bacterium]
MQECQAPRSLSVGGDRGIKAGSMWGRCLRLKDIQRRDRALHKDGAYMRELCAIIFELVKK